MSEGAEAHSIAAPSSLHQIVQCPGSIAMQRPFPETRDSESAQAAAEGTAAHWAMAEQMAGRQPRVHDRAPNGVFLTDEMIEAADLICEDVRKTVEPYGMSLASCITEVPVGISRIHPLCWGTPDVRVWLPTPVRSTLVVWDLKFGFRNVSAFENHQLVAYSVGCIEQTRMSDLDVQVVNRIVQPRSYHRDGPVREWRYVASDVRALVNIMHMAVTEALGDNPRTNVGPACRDCRGAHACETLQRAGEAAMDKAGAAMPHVLDPVPLGVELRNVTRLFKLLQARKDALEEQAKALARGGARIPHFKVESSVGRQVWKRPEPEVIALGQMLGLDLAKPPSAITPQQAIARGFNEQLASSYIERKTGALTLVPDDGSELRRIFSTTNP
jgi:hypothetical protein